MDEEGEDFDEVKRGVDSDSDDEGVGYVPSADLLTATGITVSSWNHDRPRHGGRVGSASSCWRFLSAWRLAQCCRGLVCQQSGSRV